MRKLAFILFIFISLNGFTKNKIIFNFDSCNQQNHLPNGWQWNKIGLFDCVPYIVYGSDTIWAANKIGNLIFLQKDNNSTESPTISTVVKIPNKNKISKMDYSAFYSLQGGYNSSKAEAMITYIGFNTEKSERGEVFRYVDLLFLPALNKKHLGLATTGSYYDGVEKLNNYADSLEITITYFNPGYYSGDYIALDNLTISFDTLVTNAVNDITQSNSLTLYPNPTQNTLHISTTKEISGSLCLQDISGKQILLQQNFNTNQTIDVAHLAKGIYIITLKNNEAVWHGKFVKE